MKTFFEKVNQDNPAENQEVFDRAAHIIQNGGLVAFPTETVYGLGANALNPLAVKKIYQAKGRPSDNPLIVHISDISELEPLVKNISPKAKALMDNFWPGPLTIIFEKSDLIPKETSGGLDTVAIRFPQDKVAQFLIKASKRPIAAPSANSSGKPSPTHASHVAFDLDGKIDMIIDGGHCNFGLESTIVDVTSETPYLLRPGSITLSMLESVIGEVKVDKAVLSKLNEGEKPKAPGMKYKHYSPSADVVIIKGELDNITKEIKRLTQKSNEEGKRVCIIATKQTEQAYKGLAAELLIIGDRNKPETIAANLFKMLRKCDFLNMDKVYVEAFDESEVGLAIMNRLKKAAGYNIVNV